MAGRKKPVLTYEDDIENCKCDDQDAPGSSTGKAPRFSDLELEVLTNFLFEEKDIVESTETDGISPETKRSTWNLICNRFNEYMRASIEDPVVRSTKQLRNSWNNMKALARKIDSENKRLTYQETGNPKKLKLSKRQELIYNAVIMIKPDLDFTLKNPFDSTSVYELNDSDGFSNDKEFATDHDQFLPSDKNDNYVDMESVSTSRKPLKAVTPENSPQKSQSVSSTFEGKGSKIRKLVEMPHLNKGLNVGKCSATVVPDNSMKRPCRSQENTKPQPTPSTSKKPRSQPSVQIPPIQDNSKFEDLKQYQDEMFRGKISVLNKEVQYWAIKCKSAELEQTTQKLELEAAEKKLKYYVAKYRKDLGLDGENPADEI